MSSPAFSAPSSVGVVVATTWVQALLAFAVLTPPAIAPALGSALGLPSSSVGYWVSLVYGAAMMSALMGGQIVRRFGAGRTSQAGAAMCGLGAALAMAAWLPAMAVAALLIGGGYGLVNPASSHLLAKVAKPHNRNLLFSIKQTGVPIGGTLAGLLTPRVAVAFGWEAAMALLVALSVLTVVALQPARAGWDADRDASMSLRGNPFAGLVTIWRRPAVRWLSISAFFYAFVQLCVTTFMVALLVAEGGYALIAAGMVLSVTQVAGILGRLAWGWLADKVLGSVLALAMMGVLMVAAALLTSALDPGWPLWAVYCTLILFGGSAIGWNGVFLAEIARTTPLEQISRVTGASLFFTFGGVLVGPAGFAMVHGVIGDYRSTYGLLAVIAAAGLSFVALTMRAGRGGSAS